MTTGLVTAGSATWISRFCYIPMTATQFMVSKFIIPDVLQQSFDRQYQSLLFHDIARG